MDEETLAAYQKILLVAKRFVSSVHLSPPSDLELDGVDSSSMANNADFAPDIEGYFQDLEYSKIRTLDELILLNKENSELELPPGYSNQNVLISSPISVAVKEVSHSIDRLCSQSKEFFVLGFLHCEKQNRGIERKEKCC